MDPKVTQPKRKTLKITAGNLNKPRLHNILNTTIISSQSSSFLFLLTFFLEEESWSFGGLDYKKSPAWSLTEINRELLGKQDICTQA